MTAPSVGDAEQPKLRDSARRYINGRAETVGPGGFARYHREVTKRLVVGGAASVLRPPDRWTDPLRARWWEQHTLPSLAADGVLLSMANNGPLRHRRQAVVLHDLLPLTHPHTVSPLFAGAQRRLLPALSRSAAAIVTPSHHVADLVIDRLGVDHGGVTIAPPGISPVFTQPRSPEQRAADQSLLGLPADRIVVSALVSSIPRKRATATLEVLAEVARQRPEILPVVAGYDGPGRVFGARTERPFHPGVKDLTEVEDSVLAALFRTAEIFVFLSDAEGFGLPPVEAMACGAAVVSTAAPSLVEHGGNAARLVPNPEAAVTEVLQLIDNPRLTADLGEAGRAAVSSLDWDRTAAEIDDLLLRLET